MLTEEELSEGKGDGEIIVGGEEEAGEGESVAVEEEVVLLGVEGGVFGKPMLIIAFPSVGIMPVSWLLCGQVLAVLSARWRIGFWRLQSRKS